MSSIRLDMLTAAWLSSIITIEKLKTEKITVVAIEQTKQSVSLAKFKVPESVAYIMGNEVGGVSDEALALSDVVVDLPMLGQKESLNVSVTAGVVLYHGLV